MNVKRPMAGFSHEVIHSEIHKPEVVSWPASRKVRWVPRLGDAQLTGDQECEELQTMSKYVKAAAA